MPPQRTNPPQRTVPPARPVKTERTHEENQERAYIAASRRSDRSLEARVESARRASEIHKKRTGRSLRVTEQDVINEEMYEEEDDDLPSQYRRLTAHLQTNSTAFNQRLAAYLAGQVGVRSAIDQYFSNPYGQGLPHDQQFPPSQQPMLENPAWNQQFQQPMMQATPPSMYRQAPYPMPNMQQRMQARSVSIPTPQMTSINHQSTMAADEEKRRQSIALPVGTTSFTQAPAVEVSPSDLSSDPKTISVASPQSAPDPLQPATPSVTSGYRPGRFNSGSLLTTALPQESQMLLGSTLDPQDPMTNRLMTGSQYLSSSYFNFDSTLPPTFDVGKDFTSVPTDPEYDGLVYDGLVYDGLKYDGLNYHGLKHDGLNYHGLKYDGLNTTLAPSDLEINSGLDYKHVGQTSFLDAATKETIGNGTGTPGGNEFNLFIDQDQWNEVSSSQ